MSDATSGYFAADGQYYDDCHHVLSIYVSNNSGTETIDLSVDVGDWRHPLTGSIYWNDYDDFFEFSRE